MLLALLLACTNQEDSGTCLSPEDMWTAVAATRYDGYDFAYYALDPAKSGIVPVQCYYFHDVDGALLVTNLYWEGSAVYVPSYPGSPDVTCFFWKGPVAGAVPPVGARDTGGGEASDSG